MKNDFSNTYWEGKGKYQEFADKLSELIPTMGSVENPTKNKALEKFRIAGNCYYDLYNNGLHNRAAEFRKVFGFAAAKAVQHSYPEEIVRKTDEKMDEFVLKAAIEQGFVQELDDLINNGY